MTPLISIVTGTYNRITSLQRMLESVRENMPVGVPYEIILVDGGSTDGTLEWLAAQKDVWTPNDEAIVVIEQGELLGAIRAFCDGAKAARGKYVVLANDDITFFPHSIMAAFTYLERKENARVGAVAFADNRPQVYKRGQFEVDVMQSTNTPGFGVVYAQVGMFRAWLGHRVGWWGADDAAFHARTYGGDNYLSSKIWEAGYTVDAVEECRVHDFFDEEQDELRSINAAIADTGWRELWPNGVTVKHEPQWPQEDKTQLRVLYLPIYEPGHLIQRRQKRGLRDALAQVGVVWEIDYLGTLNPIQEVENALVTFQPHLVLSQFHGADKTTIPLVHAIRRTYPPALLFNWNGDVWFHGLTSNEMLALLRHVDLQLCVNVDAVRFYEQKGIPAAYWQIGIEPGLGEPRKAESCDILFAGNNNAAHPARQRMIEIAAEGGWTLHIWGDGWEGVAARFPNVELKGNCLYDFDQHNAIVKKARVVLGDNSFPDVEGFVSNRVFQSLAPGGGMLLHGAVLNLEEWTGLRAGEHYEAFADDYTLKSKLEWFLNTPEGEKERKRIAKSGKRYAMKHHTFLARVRQLIPGLMKKAERQMGGVVAIEHTNPKAHGGIKGMVTGTQYVIKPGEKLLMDSRDAQALMQTAMSNQWRRVKEED